MYILFLFMFRSTMSYFSDKTYFRGLKHERIKICLLVSNAATGCFPCAGNIYYMFNFQPLLVVARSLKVIRKSTLYCKHYLTEGCMKLIFHQNLIVYLDCMYAVVAEMRLGTKKSFFLKVAKSYYTQVYKTIKKCVVHVVQFLY